MMDQGDAEQSKATPEQSGGESRTMNPVLVLLISMVVIGVLIVAVQGGTNAFGSVPVILLVLGGAAFYFIPSFVARRKPNAGSVFVINLFFGWTFIGWVVALAMAAKDPVQPVVVQAPPAPGPAPATPVGPSLAPVDEKACPFCAETIKAAAIVCKHCGRDLPAD